MPLKGKIYKGIGGFYYVHTPEGDYECRAKGIFRNRNEKPLVGDDAEIEPVQDSEKEREGSVIRILPRKNQLIRPEVANIDQAVVVFALKHPDPNLSLLDRFLINMEQKDIPVVIFFNKVDLIDSAEPEEEPVDDDIPSYKKKKKDRAQFIPEIHSDHPELIPEIYRRAGYKVLEISTRSGDCYDKIMEVLQGKTTVLSGPSGVGKSSITNLIHPEANMEIGELSKKIERGKNTTRHTEFFYIDDDTYVLDTPGFTSLYINDIETDRLMYYFPEFEKYRHDCRFKTCIHIGENDCAVKKAVQEGLISKERYESYVLLYDELKSQRRY
ncbi:ribosome small subunit-dependent GTPase A [Oribacterium sp. C9]|uniref:ribosome small subunit-dependent GTPase A n=1 Tax=Oribacterium sp. C9 TaxID=1943579 RepID=UPI00098F7316|nr:ribosome small subunit-dependent GTPase A [Oribacterium sp. C9]OON85500.1 ribosome small subunit-dependent GTPase A [Oribacterium sp. C9]